ncbi:conjugal transfer protein TraR [Bowmanella denitrificans]|uniref:conjugal transfer protein TraR n=1 Tax=Bowmanella denitrificans TaxID=366582 RepID=UPI000C9CA119|nr:conjugal transfer protein TraR [Bowmanella denitrificans]
MDIIDRAQLLNEQYQKAALAGVRTPAPAAPLKLSATGQPLCIGCDADITQRRLAMPHTQYCTDCQQLQEQRSRR